MTNEKHKPLTEKDIWIYESTTQKYRSYYEEDVLSALAGLKTEIIKDKEKQFKSRIINNELLEHKLLELIDKWFDLKEVRR